MKKFVVLFIFLSFFLQIFLLSCASIPHYKMPETAKKAKNYDLNKSVIWKIVLETLIDLNFRASTTNRNSGYIHAVSEKVGLGEVLAFPYEGGGNRPILDILITEEDNEVKLMCKSKVDMPQDPKKNLERFFEIFDKKIKKRMNTKKRSLKKH